MDEFIVLLVIIQAFVCGCYAAHVANQKGYSYWSWFAGGFFFGILGLIAAAGLPLRNEALPGSDPTRECPDCMRTIRHGCRVCPFCGHTLTVPEHFRALASTLDYDLSSEEREQIYVQLLTIDSFEEIETALEGVPSQHLVELKRRFRSRG